MSEKYVLLKKLYWHVIILENLACVLIEKLKMIKSLLLYKSSNDSLYFYGDLYKRFHILLSNEK